MSFSSPASYPKRAQAAARTYFRAAEPIIARYSPELVLRVGERTRGQLDGAMERMRAQHVLAR